MKKAMVLMLVLILTGSLLLAFRGSTGQMRGREDTVVENRAVERNVQLRQEKLEKQQMVQEKKLLQFKDDPDHECEDCEDCGEPEQKMTQTLKQEKKLLNVSQQKREQINDQSTSIQGRWTWMTDEVSQKEVQRSTEFMGRRGRSQSLNTTSKAGRMLNNSQNVCDCDCGE